MEMIKVLSRDPRYQSDGRCPVCNGMVILFKSVGKITTDLFIGTGTYKCPECGFKAMVVEYQERR